MENRLDVFFLPSAKERYNESVFDKSEADIVPRAQWRLHRRAGQLGFSDHPRGEWLMLLENRHCD